MSEGMKTLVWSGIALVLAVVAFVTRPSDTEFSASDVEQFVGKPLFPDFKDPAAAARLEIVRVLPDVGKIDRFEVARDKRTDLWTIPSHNGYPADAANQMRDVSVMFIDLNVLGIASSVADDHALYGVLEPDPQTATSGDGVGMLVNVENRDGDKLASIIIGKPVKGTENERFVRKPGQDPVYVVSIDPSKLSTKFSDWIEKDLLKLNTWDIDEVRLMDYSVIGSLQQGSFALDQRLDVSLKWDETQAQWKLDKMYTFKGRNAIPAQMAPDEELNTAKLNELKSALDDLAIVDVYRKPKGMGADLRADKGFMNDLESVQSLVDKGFYPLAVGPNDPAELKSANGEIHVGMKDGVEYILRFGDTVPGSEADKVNRFLFVTARFDETRFPMPEKPAEPGAPTAPATPPPASEGSDATGSPKAESPAEETPKSDAGTESNGTSGEGCQETEEPAKAEAADSQPPEAAESPKPESTEPAKPETKPVPPADQPAAESEEVAAERERLQKEYQRKLDERKKKIEDGQQKVRELNARFADWYYVIDEDLYRKIHLGRSDIFKAKAGTTEEGFGVDAFRKLEAEGLKKTP